MFLAAATGAGSSSSMIIILLLFFVLMWFFMIRPEKKKQKKIEAMRSALSVGDEIVTIGGIMGTIVHVTEDDITAEFEKAGVKDVEASKAEFIADGRMPAVRESIRRSKAVDHLVENAKVTEVDETAKDAE